jgi:uncharacterized protein YecE (DUF72 family)
LSTQSPARGRVRIGCASWSILSRHADLFGPGGSTLARYATRFDCVEINSSFYRPHQRKTYARWATEVPRDFRFAVKLPKLVTHEMRLHGVAKPLDAFTDEVGGLGGKLGALLVQLPPSLALEPAPAAAFFAMLRRRFPRTPIACEPRHASWFTPRGDALWDRHRIARVAADPAPVPQAATPGGVDALRYWRMHGSPRMYYSAYGDATLDALALALRAGVARGQRWAVFDNTAHGHSVADAARLQSRLASPRSLPAR